MEDVEWPLEGIIPLTPYDVTPEEDNGSDLPLTASQHRLIISDILMDWMDTNNIDYERAAEILEVSTHVIVEIINCVPISSLTFLTISNKIEGFSNHLIGART